MLQHEASSSVQMTSGTSRKAGRSGSVMGAAMLALIASVGTGRADEHGAGAKYILCHDMSQQTVSPRTHVSPWDDSIV